MGNYKILKKVTDFLWFAKWFCVGVFMVLWGCVWFMFFNDMFS